VTGATFGVTIAIGLPALSTVVVVRLPTGLVIVQVMVLALNALVQAAWLPPPARPRRQAACGRATSPKRVLALAATGMSGKRAGGERCARVGEVLI
jgi:hypothetical protein